MDYDDDDVTDEVGYSPIQNITNSLNRKWAFSVISLLVIPALCFVDSENYSEPIKSTSLTLSAFVLFLFW